MWLAPYFVPMHLQLARLNNFKYARARVEDRIKAGGRRGDFWDKVEIKSAEDNASGEGPTRDEMVVSAVTLVGTFFLGRNPHAMEALTREIRTSFSAADEINLVSVHKLKYLTACLEDTMRLYPPVITMLWRTPPRGAGQSCGVRIPEGVRPTYS